jgi:flagellin-like hook-associated protein FlgL
MERLLSGLRIHSAADDAAGLAVANKMKSQLRGIEMAMRNSMDGAVSSFKSYSVLNKLLFSFDQ